MLTTYVLTLVAVLVICAGFVVAPPARPAREPALRPFAGFPGWMRFDADHPNAYEREPFVPFWRMHGCSP